MPATDIATSTSVARELAADLLQRPREEVDAATDAVLRRLGEHLGVDRLHVSRRDGLLVRTTHEWCAPGIPARIERLRELPLARIADWVPRLDADEPVEVPDVTALPEGRADERSLLAALGVRSLLAVPLTLLGRSYGVLVVHAVRSHRAFDRAELAVVRQVADLLAASLVSARAVERAVTSEDRIRVVTENATELIAVVAGGVVTWAGPSWRRIGIDPEASIGRPITRLVHREDVTRAREVLAAAEQAPRSERGTPHPLPDTRLRGGGSRVIWVRGTVTDLRHEPAVDGLLVSLQDVTDQLEAERQLAESARRDPLTGLANRLALNEHITASCAVAARTGDEVHVLLLDLDGFKLINDSLGHRAGDDLLVEVGRRLREAVGSQGLVARFGGDEFVVVVRGSESRAASMAERLLAVLAEPHRHAGHKHRLTASIGVSSWRGGEVDTDVLVGDADIAMFSAKDEGRNRVVWFDDSFRATVVREHELVAHLVAALDAGVIEAHHQPLVDMRTSSVVGHEALARWTDRTLGVVSPSEFIPVAERAGLVGRLGAQVLRSSLRTSRTWPAGQYASVNLSVAQLQSPDLATEVCAALDDAGVPPSRLVVEVTESLVMRDPEQATAVLAQLRAMGVRVALDDFGTGHSSLALVHDLPLDVLKIDRAFVDRVDTDQRARSMVTAVLAICDELDLVSVAEGIERPEQRDVLLEHGCAIGQGWLFGRPVPPPGG